MNKSNVSLVRVTRNHNSAVFNLNSNTHKKILLHNLPVHVPLYLHK